MSTQAIAKVSITVEVTLVQPWSGDSPLEAVFNRGSRQAVETVQRVINERSDIRIVGTPLITAILVSHKS